MRDICAASSAALSACCKEKEKSVKRMRTFVDGCLVLDAAFVVGADLGVVCHPRIAVLAVILRAAAGLRRGGEGAAVERWERGRADGEERESEGQRGCTYISSHRG